MAMKFNSIIGRSWPQQIKSLNNKSQQFTVFVYQPILEMSRGLNKFKGRYLYRALRPLEDAKHNLTCVAPASSLTIGEHVETGLSSPSKYISTSSSLICTLNWMKTFNDFYFRKFGKQRSTIVKIDVNLIKEKYPFIANSAVDLTNKDNQEKFLVNPTQKWLAISYQEVIFENMIPSEATTIEISHSEDPPSDESGGIMPLLFKYGEYGVSAAAMFIFGSFF